MLGESGPTASMKARTAAGGSSASSMPSPLPGVGAGGSMCSCSSSAMGCGCTESISGARARSGASSSSARSGYSWIAASTTTNDLPERNGGSSGIGGKRRRRPTEVTLSGTSAVHVGPRLQDLLRALEREEERAGDDLGDREEAELERGDDAEVAAAAAKGPEQLGVVLGVDPAAHAVGGDELDGEHLVGASPCERASQLMPPPRV